MAVRLNELNEWAVSSPLHNKLAERDRPVHAWYRFVLSFPPHLVRDYFEKLGANQSSVVLDPFCGTGTTLVEAKKHGIASIGIEANPMAVLASKVKTNWHIDPIELLKNATQISNSYEHSCLELPKEEGITYIESVCEQPNLYGLLNLNSEQANLILRNSISPLPLHRCLLLKGLIQRAPEIYRDHLLLALAYCVVTTAGNIKFGPEVGITKPKIDAPVIEEWFKHVKRIADDVNQFKYNASVSSTLISGDARTVSSGIKDCSVDIVFTSPPYPNEKDYTRTTRLESVILELIKSKSDLRELKKGLLRSNTRNVYVDDLDDLEVSGIYEIQQLAEEIERRRIELGKTSGFERLYHRVTKHYFGGMALHFREMKRVLKPGAMLGYVVGDQASYLQVMIRTGELLSQVAQREGYEVVSIDLFRTRLATATKQQLREEVVILRWPGAK